MGARGGRREVWRGAEPGSGRGSDVRGEGSRAGNSRRRQGGALCLDPQNPRAGTSVRTETRGCDSWVVPAATRVALLTAATGDPPRPRLRPLGRLHRCRRDRGTGFRVGL